MPPVTPETPWFDALMAREDLFEQLVEREGAAAKFQRVLLDEQIARRLSVGDVAAMLAVSAEDLAALAAGADLDGLAATAALPAGTLPWPDRVPDAVVDTRPIFEAGFEPLPALLDAADSLGGAQLLLVVAPFHPQPLRRLLGRRGFASAARQEADGWRIAFRREGHA
jgi:hypothetical protein